jgi:hypothetical protein
METTAHARILQKKEKHPDAAAAVQSFSVVGGGDGNTTTMARLKKPRTAFHSTIPELWNQPK